MGLRFANTLFRTCAVVRSHVLVNQFPYEACLVRKDLLLQTLRRLHSASTTAGAQEQQLMPLFRNAQLCMGVAGGLSMRSLPFRSRTVPSVQSRPEDDVRRLEMQHKGNVKALVQVPAAP